MRFTDTNTNLFQSCGVKLKYLHADSFDIFWNTMHLIMLFEIAATSAPRLACVTSMRFLILVFLDLSLSPHPSFCQR